MAVSEADIGGHGLVDTDNPGSDYQSLFTESNENNPEFLFSVRNSSTDVGLNHKELFSWQQVF